MNYLLIDTLPLVYIINESETVNGVRKLRGLFHMAETKNANKRIYPKRILEREVKKIMPAVKERRVLGEINHPQAPEINLERSSHIITDLRMDGNKVYGELEVLKTPNGKILEALIDSDVKLGISSRGVGSLSESNGVKVVQDNYNLITWDVVANPSTPNAWVHESTLNPVGGNFYENGSDLIILDGYDGENFNNDKITNEIVEKIQTVFRR